jgi:mannose-6-phosphate isomerase-like protein (cupin superfamily)
MVIFHIDPCGINLPHVHQRATELFFIVEGTFKATFI